MKCDNQLQHLRSTVPFLLKSAFLIYCLCARLGFSADYYVETTGSNTNRGTSSAPWQTLQYALSKVTPGDIIHLGEGHFPGGGTTFTDGISDSYITIAGQGTNKTVVSGKLTLKHDYYVVMNAHWTTNYLSLQGDHNLIVSNLFTQGAAGIYMQGGTGDLTDGGSHNAIVANTFTDLVGNGAVVTIGQNNLISSNRFLDLNGYDALRVWGLNITISDNEFLRIISGGQANPPHSNHADVIQTFDTSTHATARGIVFERNRITDSTSQFGNLEGGALADIGDWTIRYNLWNNSRIQLNNYIPGVKFYQNTVYLNPNSTGIRFASSDTRGSAHNGVIANNLFVRVGLTATSGFYTVDPSLSGMFVAGNLATGPDDALKILTGDLLGQINLVTPKEIFIDPTRGDFRLASNSPARGGGVDLSQVLTDLVDSKRSVWDIGALPYQEPPQNLRFIVPQD